MTELLPRPLSDCLVPLLQWDTMTTRDGLGPEYILEKNDVYARWRELIDREHLAKRDAQHRVARELGLPAERVRDGIFAGQLTESEIRYRAVADAHERARTERNGMVGEALRRGWSHSEVALATGLSRARVGQIAQPQDADTDQRSSSRRRDWIVGKD